jgi:chromosome segregation ATPase
MLEGAIEFISREIEAKEARIVGLTALIEKLQGRTEPDRELIAEFRSEIDALNSQLESDRAQLTAFTEEFQANCPSK